MNDPFSPFRRWLEWLDSHDGRIHRCKENKAAETEFDLVCLIPTPTGQTIYTIGDLRALVAAGTRLKELERLVVTRIVE